MLDIEESTSRSQCTRAKTMLETILVKKKILEKPGDAYVLTAAFKKLFKYTTCMIPTIQMNLNNTSRIR